MAVFRWQRPTRLEVLLSFRRWKYTPWVTISMRKIVGGVVRHRDLVTEIKTTIFFPGVFVGDSRKFMLANFPLYSIFMPELHSLYSKLSNGNGVVKIYSSCILWGMHGFGHWSKHHSTRKESYMTIGLLTTVENWNDDLPAVWATSGKLICSHIFQTQFGRVSVHSTRIWS